MNKVKFFKPKDAVWVNADGDKVPFKYIPKSDRAKETAAEKIYKAAIDVEGRLSTLHLMMTAAFADIDTLVREEYELKTKQKKAATKGGISFYSFDKTIKVEASIDEIVKWDDTLMKEAHTLLKHYLSSRLGDASLLISGLVNKAFSNSKGSVNTASVFEILKYKTIEKDKGFQKACELMQQAQSIDRKKLYMKASVRMEDGSYRNINLQFSNV